MPDIAQREDKIKEKRKATPWRDFLMEIGSWLSIMFYPRDGEACRYPDTGRIKSIVSNKEYMNNYEDFIQDSEQNITDQSFLQQFTTLFTRFVFPATYQFFGCENTKYGDVIHESKNVYLGFMITTGSENILYSLSVKQASVDVLNSVLVVQHSHNVYSSYSVSNSYKIFYSKNILNSSNCRFSSNLTGCNECILCNNLENQSYCISNQQYTKEEYQTMKETLLKDKSSYDKHHQWMLSQPLENYNAINYTGTGIIQSENIQNGLYVNNVKNARNVCLMTSDEGAYDIYDCVLGGTSDTHELYGALGCGLCHNLYCCVQCGTCSKMYYSMFCENSSYCLGCIGLKNKQFCILNKEYSKEEWFALADKIFAQMESDGTLGTFFPASMNPFYFNDTVAYMIDDSFTKEEVIKEGYLRRDEEIKVDIPNDAEIVYSTPNLPAGRQAPSKIKEGNSPSILEGAGGSKKTLDDFQGFSESGERKINPEILKKVIKDDKGNYYRIVPMELAFLQKYGLPLPEIHWLERIKLGFKFK